jgi:hypothetical protein
MVRAFKLAVAAIAMLAAASFVSLAMGSDAAAQPAAAAAATLPVETAPAAPRAIAPFVPAAAPAPVAPAPVAAPAPQPERDEFKDWSASVATLPQDLGSELGPSLKLGLDETRNNDMAFCFRDLEPGAWSTRASDFVLYLEARDGVVDVIDAKVARPGTLPPSVLECCRDVFRGLEVKVFSSKPGERFSYIYEVEA